MSVQRTSLLNYGAEDQDFSVESWFIPMPNTAQESVTRVALIWTKGDVESVVLLSPKKALEVASELMRFADKASR